jgi:hypothetical protein
MIPEFLPLILLYPEIHYRFRYFPFSRYFKKEPEILIDLPYKSKNGKLPVFLIVKDSHIYPLFIWSVKFQFVFEDGSVFIKTVLMNKKTSSPLSFEQFDFEFNDKNGFVNVGVEIFAYCGGKLIRVVNDNFYGIETDLESYLGDDEELFDNHFQGDLHYHSDYTSDHVEFGAPVSAAASCARTIGLDFFAVTDHSYDLDDEENNYLKKDPELKKFKSMRKDCAENSDGGLTVIAGEEVTVRNALGRNVHLLVYEQEYFEGKGDGAEKWFDTKSENSIDDVASKIPAGGVAIAAHPFNKVPFLEYLLVKRGKWSEADIIENKITHIQILNGDYDDNFFAGLNEWKKLLLKGNRVYITAGNDAHGNFNLFRQVKFPMFSLISKNRQIFGRCRTVVSAQSREKQDLIKGIEEGNIYITNGPHLLFSVMNGGRVFDQGSSFKAEPGVLEAEIFINSSVYSGTIKSILAFRGAINSSVEKMIWKKEFSEEIRTFNGRIELKSDRIDQYVRLEVFTSHTHSNGKFLEHRAYSNPIWIMK